MKFECIGSNGELDTYFCYDLLEKIGKEIRSAKEVTTAEVEGVPGDDEEKKSDSVETGVKAEDFSDFEVKFESYLEIDYVMKMRNLQKERGGPYNLHKLNHIVLLDGEYFGGIEQVKAMAKDRYGLDVEEFNTVYYGRLQREDFAASVKGLGKLVYMDFEDGSRMRDATTPEYGKIVIELFEKTVPLASENFLKLCTGELGATEFAKLHYQGCPVHRIVENGWFQCGDIVEGTGRGSYAALGEEGKVKDESFVCDFGSSLGGVVGYSTSSSHSNGSQFFVTLGPCEWMNGSYVGVGRVVQGFDILAKISKASVSNQKPDPPIICGKAGKFDA